MSETVLFNPGDSIGNFHDYNEAVKKGHLYKQKKRDDDELVIVKGPHKNEEYAIFYVKDRQAHPNEDSAPYQINDRI